MQSTFSKPIRNILGGALFGLIWGMFLAYEEWLLIFFGSHGPVNIEVLVLLAYALVIYGVCGCVVGIIIDAFLGVFSSHSEQRTPLQYSLVIVVTLTLLWGGLKIAFNYIELSGDATLPVVIFLLILGTVLAAVCIYHLHRDSGVISRHAFLIIGFFVIQALLGVGFKVNSQYLPLRFSLTSLASDAGMILVAIFIWLMASFSLRYLGASRRRMVSSIIIVFITAFVVSTFSYVRSTELSGLLKDNIFSQKDGEDEQLPNIVFITVDTLRADHLGSYGYGRMTSPAIDKLGSSGVLFENAYAQSSWTRPSVASYMTSQFPSETGVVLGTNLLQESSETLGEYLQAKGYFTAAIIGNHILKEQYGDAQGFDLFLDAEIVLSTKPLMKLRDFALNPAIEWLVGADENPSIGRYADAKLVTETTLDLLSKHMPEPFFLYVHYMDPHTPYKAPTPHRGRWSKGYTGVLPDLQPVAWDKLLLGRYNLTKLDLQFILDRYDEEIAYTDVEIGKLLDGYEGMYDAERTLFVFTSDHGEEFTDHEGFGHAHTLYKELTHVPLIFAGLNIKKDRRNISEVMGLVDIFPTIAEAIGGEVPSGLRGTSWWGILASGDAVTRHNKPVWAEVEYERGWKSLRTQEWTYLLQQQGKTTDDPRWEGLLFDRIKDPNEQVNIAKVKSGVASSFYADIEAMEMFMNQNRGETVTVPFDKATEERLRALGYVH